MTTALVRGAVQSKRMSQRDNSEDDNLAAIVSASLGVGWPPRCQCPAGARWPANLAEAKARLAQGEPTLAPAEGSV